MMYREESNRRESIIAFFDAFASNYEFTHSTFNRNQSKKKE